MNITTTTTQIEPAPETAESVIERFCLYEFFRAPGLCYHPGEDPKTGIEQQQQMTTLASVDEVENEQNQEELNSHNDNDKDQARSNQHLTSNAPKTATQNEHPKNGDKWAEFPFMNKDIYGYRLCSSMELRSFKVEWENMK